MTEEATSDLCALPLVVHRVDTFEITSSGKRKRLLAIHECPKPDCAAEPERHGEVLPCRWSWQFAHGKAFNGESFPKRRCPGCDHISRSGTPQESVRAG